MTKLESELMDILINCKVERIRLVQIMVQLWKIQKFQELKDWILKQKTLPTQEKIIAKTEKIIAKI